MPSSGASSRCVRFTIRIMMLKSPQLLLRGLSLLALIILFSCRQQVDWITYRGEFGSGATRNAIYPPLGLRWKLPLQEADKNNPMEEARSFNPPIIRGSMIFFGSNDANFYALDADTGYMRWSFKTNAAVNSVPFADDKNVYFGSNDGNVYAIEQDGGKKIWQFQTGNTVQSLVLRYEDTIIFTSDTGATFFLDLQGLEKDRIENPVWSHHTFQVYDGIVYWAPLERSFGAYEMKTRKFLWTVPVPSQYSVWYSFPALDEKQVYYASSIYRSPVELHYYAADRKTGEQVWEVTDTVDLGEKTPVNRDTAFMRHVALLDYLAPSVWRNFVIFTSGDIFVRAFNTETGEVVWKAEFDYPTSSAPTIAGDRVYFGVRGDENEKDGGGVKPKLVCLSVRDGKILWQMDLDGPVLNSPVISGKRMIFGTENNLFYVLEEIF